LKKICKNYTDFLVKKVDPDRDPVQILPEPDPIWQKFRIRNAAAHLFEAAERSVPILPPLILQEYKVGLPAPTGPALSFYCYNDTRTTGPALSFYCYNDTRTTGPALSFYGYNDIRTTGPALSFYGYNDTRTTGPALSFYRILPVTFLCTFNKINSQRLFQKDKSIA
jgi:hypothetical protein